MKQMHGVRAESPGLVLGSLDPNTSGSQTLANIAYSIWQPGL